MENYKVLRAGYDGLDVSFFGYVPPSLLDAMERAKADAARGGEGMIQVTPELVVHVAETGARGGYAYRVDTGPEGETWFFKRSDKTDWNIRVSCKSAMLAKLGFRAAKIRLWERLHDFGAYFEKESVGRVDFAFDFLCPAGFEIDPALVVAHQNSGVSENGVKLAKDMQNVTPDETEVSCIASRARRVQTLTIGKMPGRQVTVYDKTAEVKAKGKSWWWQVWRLKEGTQVFRLEVRAGKKYLKERVGVTTYADLEAKLPDIIQATLLKIRLCDPKKAHLIARNVSRTGHHPMWEAAMWYVMEKWAETLKGCEPVRVIREERKRLADIFERQLAGSIIGFANVCGVDREGFKRFTQALGKRLEGMESENPSYFAKKWRKSGEKYANLTGQFHGYESAYATA